MIRTPGQQQKNDVPGGAQGGWGQNNLTGALYTYNPYWIAESNVVHRGIFYSKVANRVQIQRGLCGFSMDSSEIKKSAFAKMTFTLDFLGSKFIFPYNS